MKRPAVALIALVADGLLVVLFVFLGRAQHDEAGTIAGIWGSAWPFLLALALSWALALAWREPLAALRTGVPLWAGTVAIGMAVRVLLTDGGAAPAFIAVACGVLAVFLIGWRLIALAVSRGLRRSTTIDE